MPSLIITKYKKILEGTQKRFSPYEFEDNQFRKKKIQLIIRYAVEEVKKWTPEQAKNQLSLHDIKKLKLHLIIEFIQPPIEAKTTDVYYIIDYAYPYLPKLSEKQKAIWVYQEVLNGSRRHFPMHYFQSVLGEERSKVCFVYMCEELIKITSILELPRIFGKTERAYQILRTYRLKILVDTLYFSPFDLITEIYPELAEPRLWDEEGIFPKQKHF
ncbi:hypothetical protein EEL32_16125 [Brevibacillus laterosporus]|uniref:DUF4046 domain-containing protein n=1 Tax=Brevibacillus laterosporus TaxID=1465 RepID=A0A502IBL7_BRELA|nr:hypothetical protein [Brevibacillus laterosporus]QDX92010.1 hypothetical protein EEL30_06295 [Brevibacillus laterosporus]RAP27196.1 hypothetical protein C2W64_01028 [Brevibacillus laterosporus]TPG70384.1 hypothetical protein EEL31_19050 [Brevibacillus laterosporus]TPG84291.1 hypothetical protein EEL32_16125 [Brevibacillus laterosporus]